MMITSKKQCEFKSERSLRKVLNDLEKQFKDHYLAFRSTCKDQEDILDAMWVLSQRFLILTKGAICVRPYPREPTNREERELKAKFNEKKELLRGTNGELSCSLCAVKKKCRVFDRALAKMDPSLPSRIVQGDEDRQPIFHFIELFADLFKFFHYKEKRLNSLGSFLEIDDIGSIVEYKHLLEPESIVNEYFEKCLQIEYKSETKKW